MSNLNMLFGVILHCIALHEVFWCMAWVEMDPNREWVTFGNEITNCIVIDHIPFVYLDRLYLRIGW